MPPKKTAGKAEKATKKAMTPEHKAALAAGRDQGRAVRAYLEALASQGPAKRGRKRTPDSIERRLTAIDDQLTSADPLRKIMLLQERLNLRNELGRLTSSSNIKDLEEAFVTHGAPYSKSKGITYGAWREFGVPADVLKRAGISR